MESASEQIDPVDLLAQMTEYLDRLIGFRAIEPRFEMEIVSALRCSSCGSLSRVPDECFHQSAIRIKPLAASPSATFEEMINSALQVGAERGMYCRAEACGLGAKLVRATAESFLATTPEILVVHIAWGAATALPGSNSSEASQAIKIDRGTRAPLSIPQSLLLQSTNTPDASGVPFVLRGIVCRVGDMSAQGHYVAIIGNKSSWWIANDHEVDWTADPSVAAFASGRYPILAFFEEKKTYLHNVEKGDAALFAPAKLREHGTLNSDKSEEPRLPLSALNASAPRLKHGESIIPLTALEKPEEHNVHARPGKIVAHD